MSLPGAVEFEGELAEIVAVPGKEDSTLLGGEP